MKVPGLLKRPIVAVLRMLPPRAFRGLPSRLRAPALTTLSHVLQAYPRSFKRTRTLFGFAIAGSTSDLLQRHVYVFGMWEPNISRWVRGYLKPADVVVDVGANVGYFSLLCAGRVGEDGRVIAFEPVPSIAAALRSNLELNGVDTVTVEPAIAADQDGTAEIFRSPDDNLGLSTTAPANGFASEGSVRTVRAADVIDRKLWERVRLVKVDTEGDELRALRGLEPLLRAMSAGSSALVEVTPDELAARGHSPAALVDFMRGVGFDRMFEVANSYEDEAYVQDVPEDPVERVDVPTTKTDLIFVKGEQARAPRV